MIYNTVAQRQSSVNIPRLTSYLRGGQMEVRGDESKTCNLLVMSLILYH